MKTEGRSSSAGFTVKIAAYMANTCGKMYPLRRTDSVNAAEVKIRE